MQKELTRVQWETRFLKVPAPPNAATTVAKCLALEPLGYTLLPSPDHHILDLLLLMTMSNPWLGMAHHSPLLYYWGAMSGKEWKGTLLPWTLECTQGKARIQLVQGICQEKPSLSWVCELLSPWLQLILAFSDEYTVDGMNQQPSKAQVSCALVTLRIMTQAVGRMN